MSDAASPTDVRPIGGERIFLVVADDSPELRAALTFACLRARNTGGRVGLLRLVAPADYQHWASVGNLMREEARMEAEQLLQQLAAQVVEESGMMPVLFVREGETNEELLKLIDEEPAIRILVLAAATGNKGPGPLISFLTKRTIGGMRVPVTIVPGGLNNEQLADLT